MSRRRGFTLIELLVVIAIIAILAAMLFPVFARARESARKIQCLSNVKNIAMAFQIYLTDYDRFPPMEHRAEVNQWFENNGCDLSPGCCSRNTQANPNTVQLGHLVAFLRRFCEGREWNGARRWFPPGSG